MLIKKVLFFTLLFSVVGVGYFVSRHFTNQQIEDTKHEHGPFADLIEKNLLLWPGTKKHTGTSESKPTVINFFATWCDGCKSEKATIEELGRKYWPEQVNMLGLITHDNLAKNSERTDFSNFEFPILEDVENKMAKQFGVLSVPQTILLDANGVIRFACEGPLEGNKLEDLEKAIANLTGKKENLADQPDLKREPTTSDLHGSLGKLPDFSFTNQENMAFSSNDLSPYVWIADFIFTSCRSMCPILTKKMQDLQKTFEAELQFKLVSISVDPKNDTPKRLKYYSQKNHARPGFWVFLTGDWDYTRNILVGGFRIPVPDEPAFHTDKFVLVGPGLSIKGYYEANSLESMQSLERDVRILLDEIKPAPKKLSQASTKE